MPALVVLVISLVLVGVVPYRQYLSINSISVSADVVPRSIRSLVSVKKDYSGSSTVPAYTRWTRRRRSVGRSVGRHTRSVNGYTRYLVGRRARTIGKRLLPGTCFPIA
ncbi:hypothetical protein V2W45_1394558 [Cenococcum geophilum]